MMTIEKKMTILKNVSEADKLLFEKMPFVKLTSEEVLSSLNQSHSLKTYSVSAPNREFGFLHEGAVIVFKGKIFAAWYNNEKLELSHRTPIRYSISEDEGQTWSDARIIADDPEGNTLYCPPVFGIEDGRLYLFLNEMVKADHMHALDLYVYDEEVEQFVLLWSRPIPFKLNTNVYTLPSGKRMLCGRTGPLDGFPTIPAVMITDSGKIDAPWRMVKLQEHDELPDGRPYVHPEISATLIEQTLYVFCRNDHSTLPLLFISHDDGCLCAHTTSHFPRLKSMPERLTTGGAMSSAIFTLGANGWPFSLLSQMTWPSQKDLFCRTATPRIWSSVVDGIIPAHMRAMGNCMSSIRRSTMKPSPNEGW